MTTQKAIINRITKLLIDLEKDYKVEMWPSGEGTDIVIDNTDYFSNDMNKILKKWNLKIGINDSGYVSFDYEVLEDNDPSKEIDDDYPKTEEV